MYRLRLIVTALGLALSGCGSAPAEPERPPLDPIMAEALQGQLMVDPDLTHAMVLVHPDDRAMLEDRVLELRMGHALVNEEDARALAAQLAAQGHARLIAPVHTREGERW